MTIATKLISPRTTATKSDINKVNNINNNDDDIKEGELSQLNNDSNNNSNNNDNKNNINNNNDSNNNNSNTGNSNNSGSNTGSNNKDKKNNKISIKKKDLSVNTSAQNDESSVVSSSPSPTHMAVYGWTTTKDEIPALSTLDSVIRLPSNIVTRLMKESSKTGIPTQSFCFILGFLTHDGPITLNEYKKQCISIQNKKKPKNDNNKDKLNNNKKTNNNNNNNSSSIFPGLNLSNITPSKLSLPLITTPRSPKSPLWGDANEGTSPPPEPPSSIINNNKNIFNTFGNSNGSKLVSITNNNNVFKFNNNDNSNINHITPPINLAATQTNSLQNVLKTLLSPTNKNPHSNYNITNVVNPMNRNNHSPLKLNTNIANNNNNSNNNNKNGKDGDTPIAGLTPVNIPYSGIGNVTNSQPTSPFLYNPTNIPFSPNPITNPGSPLPLLSGVPGLGNNFFSFNSPFTPTMPKINNTNKNNNDNNNNNNRINTAFLPLVGNTNQTPKQDSIFTYPTNNHHNNNILNQHQQHQQHQGHSHQHSPTNINTRNHNHNNNLGISVITNNNHNHHHNNRTPDSMTDHSPYSNHSHNQYNNNNSNHDNHSQQHSPNMLNHNNNHNDSHNNNNNYNHQSTYHRNNNTNTVSPNSTTPVVMITNLNEEEMNCDRLFTLCGVFGDVIRVKISYHKRDTAFVQLCNHRQAKTVVNSMNRIQLYGKMIHVNLSRMTKVKLPKDSPNSIMMFPEAKFLTKDYTNSKKHRYSRKNGGQKYSPLSIGQPSHILHIANLPAKSDINKLKDFLGGHKITQIEIIGKQRTCQAFVRCLSVDLACQILIDKHAQMFYGREIKISFATRSHMPSDLVKKHGYHRSHSNSPTTIQTLTINHMDNNESINITTTNATIMDDNNNNNNNNGNQSQQNSPSSGNRDNNNNNNNNSGNINLLRSSNQSGLKPPITNTSKDIENKLKDIQKQQQMSNQSYQLSNYLNKQQQRRSYNSYQQPMNDQVYVRYNHNNNNMGYQRYRVKKDSSI